MDIFFSIIIAISIVGLVWIIKAIFFSGFKPTTLNWCRPNGKFNYYVGIKSSNKHEIKLDITIDNELNSIIFHFTDDYRYFLYIPKNTTLDELHRYMTAHADNNEIIKTLFDSIKTKAALDRIFTEERDKKSCLEMFGYLKESLLYC